MEADTPNLSELLVSDNRGSMMEVHAPDLSELLLSASTKQSKSTLAANGVTSLAASVLSDIPKERLRRSNTNL